MYVGGQYADNSTDAMDQVDIFHTSLSEWRRFPRLAVGRLWPMCVECNGYLLVLGGLEFLEHDQQWVCTDYVSVFDPETGGWTESTPSPDARYEASCVACNGYVFVIGGRDLQRDEDLGKEYYVLNCNDDWRWRGPFALPCELETVRRRGLKRVTGSHLSRGSCDLSRVCKAYNLKRGATREILESGTRELILKSASLEGWILFSCHGVEDREKHSKKVK